MDKAKKYELKSEGSNLSKDVNKLSNNIRSKPSLYDFSVKWKVVNTVKRVYTVDPYSSTLLIQRFQGLRPNAPINLQAWLYVRIV